MGFEPNQPREALEERSRKFMMKLGTVSGLCLTPFAPRKYGMITKVKIKDRELQRVVFEVKKFMEKHPEASGPRWAAEERSPESGKNKRAVNDAVAAAKRAFNDIDVDSSGTIWHHSTEAARFNIESGTWVPRQAWGMFSAERVITLAALNMDTGREAASAP